MSKALNKTLGKIAVLTKQHVRDAEYDLTGAGQTRYAFQQERGRQKRQKQVAKIKRLCSQARAAALAIDQGTAIQVAELCGVTDEVLAACSYFPRNTEWAGTAPLQEQKERITALRARLRSATR